MALLRLQLLLRPLHHHPGTILRAQVPLGLRRMSLLRAPGIGHFL